MLEPLHGDRQGQHSIRVNRQFRVCFRWTQNGAEDIENCCLPLGGSLCATLSGRPLPPNHAALLKYAREGYLEKIEDRREGKNEGVRGAWQQQISAWQASGLSGAAFCKNTPSVVRPDVHLDHPREAYRRHRGGSLLLQLRCLSFNSAAGRHICGRDLSAIGAWQPLAQFCGA